MFPFKLFHVRLHLFGLHGEPEVVITFLQIFRMQRLGELEMNQFRALVAANQQFQRECSFI
jgi:hypothetical protein